MICRLDELWNSCGLMWTRNVCENFSLSLIYIWCCRWCCVRKTLSLYLSLSVCMCLFFGIIVRPTEKVKRKIAELLCKNVKSGAWISAYTTHKNCSAWQSAFKYLHAVHHSLALLLVLSQTINVERRWIVSRARQHFAILTWRAMPM